MMGISNGYQVTVIVMLVFQLAMGAAYHGKRKEKLIHDIGPSIIQVGLWVFLLVMGGFFK